MQKNSIRLLGVRRTLQLDKGVQSAKKVEKPWTTVYILISRGAGVFFPGGQISKKGHFLLKRHSNESRL